MPRTQRRNTSDSNPNADDVEHQPERDAGPSSRLGSPQPPDTVTASDGEPATRNGPDVRDVEPRQGDETAPEQPQRTQDASSGGVLRNCKTLAFELADVVEDLKDKYNIKDDDYVKLMDLGQSIFRAQENAITFTSSDKFLHYLHFVRNARCSMICDREIQLSQSTDVARVSCLKRKRKTTFLDAVSHLREIDSEFGFRMIKEAAMSLEYVLRHVTIERCDGAPIGRATEATVDEPETAST